MNLTANQRVALKWFEEGKSNLFISGPGGTGKSFLLKKFSKVMDEKGLRFLVVAPTGLAAYQVDGFTIAAVFSGMGILEGGVEKTVFRIVDRETENEHLKALEVLIIDEVSMVREEVLRVMDESLRMLRRNPNPFGGVRVIIFGDFFQLGPVNNSGENPDLVKYAFEDNFNGHRWLQLNLKYLPLEEPVRFDDRIFADVMTVLRKGERELNVNEKRFFAERIVSLAEVEDSSAIRLYSKRQEVEQFNRSVLAKLPGKEMKNQTEYFGDIRFKKSLWLDDELVLKLGSKVLLRKNDPKKAFVNGSTGIVTGFDDQFLEVQIERPLGPQKKVLLEKESFDVLNANWKSVLTGVNFPVSLADAMTIHKAQGMTIDSNVVLDLTSAWNRSLIYVALSRVRRFSDLQLLSSLPQGALEKKNERVLNFYGRITKKAA